MYLLDTQGVEPLRKQRLNTSYIVLFSTLAKERGRNLVKQ